MIGNRRHVVEGIIQDQVWVKSELRGEEPWVKKAKVGITYQHHRVPESRHCSEHRSTLGRTFSVNNKLNNDF